MINNVLWDYLKDKKPYSIAQKNRTDGCFNIVSSANLEICFLNETASDIYQLCDKQHSINEIFDSLLSLYDVSENELMEDLINTIRYMQWKRIIKLC